MLELADLPEEYLFFRVLINHVHGMKNCRVDFGKIKNMEHFAVRFSSLLGKVGSTDKKIIPDDTR